MKQKEVLMHARAWVNFENMLWKKPDTKATYCTTPFMWNIQNKQIQRRKGDYFCWRVGRGVGQEWGRVMAKRYRYIFWSDENDLELVAMVAKL